MNVDFEAAVIGGINKKYFQTPLLLVVILITIIASGHSYKLLILRWNTKKMNRSD
jgi:hypothetical protein